MMLQDSFILQFVYATGVWSESEKPFCELIQCPFDIYGAGPRLEFEFTHMGYNGVVQFSCPPGFKLVGPTNATCQQDMEWHPPPPYCHRTFHHYIYYINPTLNDSSSITTTET